MLLVALSFIKAVIGYYILSYISICLVELEMREIFIFPDPKHLTYALQMRRGRIRYRDHVTDHAVAYFIGILLYLLLLFHFLNYGAVITAMIFMCARSFDLFYELRTGIPITRRNIPPGKLSWFVSILTWIAFPILWISIYVN